MAYSIIFHFPSLFVHNLANSLLITWQIQLWSHGKYIRKLFNIHGKFLFIKHGKFSSSIMANFTNSPWQIYFMHHDIFTNSPWQIVVRDNNSKLLEKRLPWQTIKRK